MPIYEYRCAACGKQSEVLQRIHDKPLKKCAECGGALEKLISRTSFQLKGTGWYASGYASKKTPTPGGEAGGGTGGDAGSEKRGDAGSEKRGDAGGEKRGDAGGEQGGEKTSEKRGEKPARESSSPKGSKGAGKSPRNSD